MVSKQTFSRSRQAFLKKTAERILEGLSKKHSSNSMPSKYMKDMEKLLKLAGLDHQNAIVFSVLIREIKALEKKLEEYSLQFEKLERRLTKVEDDVDNLDNH